MLILQSHNVQRRLKIANIARTRLPRRTTQLFTSLEIIINRFFKSGPQFDDGFAVKTNDVIDPCNMPDKALIVVSTFDLGGISSREHCVHGAPVIHAFFGPVIKSR